MMSTTSCEILWNHLPLDEWENRFNTVRRVPLLQDYDYALTICPLRGQSARWGLIQINGQDAGLVQIQEAGAFKNILHAVILDRGPVWFDGFGTPEHIGAFFARFKKMFPDRWGRKRRIIPEVEDTSENRKIFENLGYKRLSQPGYQTIWLDLTQDEETLRGNLRKNWRNTLSKAARSGLECEVDSVGTHLPWLLKTYKADKEDKGYEGPSSNLLGALYWNFSRKENFKIFRATLDGVVVAAIVIIVHGASATYQMGWSSPDGRKTGAHNFLLWQAISVLKQLGVKDFDLGGTNDEDAKAVKQFKEGLGGQAVTLVGHYR